MAARLPTVAGLAAICASSACGRTGLDDLGQNIPVAALDGAAPAATDRACTFSASASSTTPVMAAFVGQDLLGLTPQGTLTTLFHFSASTENALGLSVVSRGDFLGAIVASSQMGSQYGDFAVDVEFVLLGLDGTVLVHHRQTSALTSEDGGGGDVGVTGNASGAFAFSVGAGDFDALWLARADGTLLGPVAGPTLQSLSIGPSEFVEPDAKGRVLGWTASAGSLWVDFDADTERPAMLAATVEGELPGATAAWGAQLFGVTTTGALATETADGVTLLAHPAIAGGASQFWYFSLPGQAMFAVPPLPSYPSTTGNLLVVDATTLEDHPIAIAYPSGFAPVPVGTWLDGDASPSPAGFGVDSSGHVTMYLSDDTVTAQLYTTSDGSNWTPVGSRVPFDQSSYAREPLVREAGGTYLIGAGDSGDDGSGSGTPPNGLDRIVRPASGVEVSTNDVPTHLSRDGACVASLASATELDIIDALTGVTTKIALPAAADPESWTSTWVPGDDAVFVLP